MLKQKCPVCHAATVTVILNIYENSFSNNSKSCRESLIVLYMIIL